jgi:hypothetical protein
MNKSVINLVFDNFDEKGKPIPNGLDVSKLGAQNSDWNWITYEPKLNQKFYNINDVTTDANFFYVVSYNTNQLKDILDDTFIVSNAAIECCKNKNLKILFVNFHEVNDDEFYVLKRIVKYISDLGLNEDNFYYINNNSKLNVYKKTLNSKINTYTSVALFEMLAKKLNRNKPIFKEDKEFLFSCHNRATRKHRIETLCFLKKYDILKDTDWTYTDTYQVSLQQIQLGEITGYFTFVADEINWLKNVGLKYSKYENNKLDLLQLDGGHITNVVTPECYTNCYINIITETNFYIPEIHISEKSFRPFYYMQLPIFVATDRHVENLRKKFGFDMFDDLIDHSYDLVKNNQKRMKMVFEEIKRLNNNKDLVIEFYKNNKDRFEKNLALFQTKYKNKKKQQYEVEIIGLADTLTKATLTGNVDVLIHTGITIVSGNSGFTTPDTSYTITIQRQAVLIIYINTSLEASIVNVEQFGTTTFTIGETITITKAQLGGGTGGNLVLSVATLGTLKTWTELRTAYLQQKIAGIDTKNRRKGGVIGADDIDTTQFTTTNVSYTDTTDPITETITYKQLKSRLNLLPTGTSDIDVYTSTGKVGIGTTPAPFIPLHIYHATDSIARIQSGTSGKSSIEFMRGIDADAFIDYRFVNDYDLFRLQFQEGTTPIQFGDTGSYLMDASITKTHFYKDFQIGGRVGIGTTPHATINMDVNGSTRLTGSVGIGTTPTASGDSFTPQLRIHSGGHTNLYMRGGSSSGIEFGLGSRSDTTPDFRFINLSGDNGLSLQYQDSSTTYGGAGSDLLFWKTDLITYYKDIKCKIIY